MNSVFLQQVVKVITSMVRSTVVSGSEQMQQSQTDITPARGLVLLHAAGEIQGVVVFAHMPRCNFEHSEHFEHFFWSTDSDDG